MKYQVRTQVLNVINGVRFMSGKSPLNKTKFYESYELYSQSKGEVKTLAYFSKIYPKAREGLLEIWRNHFKK